jgi:hypothetical protein
MNPSDLPLVIVLGLVALGSGGALLYGIFSMRKLNREMEREMGSGRSR